MTTKTSTTEFGMDAMCTWLRQAHAAVNARYPEIDWALGKTLPNSIRIPATGPLPPFLPQPSEEVIAAEKHLDFVLGVYFLREGGIGNISLEDVTEAWRRYYRLHLPKGTQ